MPQVADAARKCSPKEPARNNGLWSGADEHLRAQAGIAGAASGDGASPEAAGVRPPPAPSVALAVGAWTSRREPDEVPPSAEALNSVPRDSTASIGASAACDGAQTAGRAGEGARWLLVVAGLARTLADG